MKVIILAECKVSYVHYMLHYVIQIEETEAFESHEA